MNQYVTLIRAIDPLTGNMQTWEGPRAPGITKADAQKYLQENGLGYCKVDKMLVADIPCKPGTYEPDWSKKIDYEKPNHN
jgi:hypothetical protein